MKDGAPEADDFVHELKLANRGELFNVRAVVLSRRP